MNISIVIYKIKKMQKINVNIHKNKNYMDKEF